MSKPLRILIVEDEALLAMEMESLIQDAGHEVAGWATSARKARELAEKSEADVALVDIHLSDGPTGVEVAEYIATNHDSMVVFLTANPSRVPHDFSGALGVISKPYTVHGLNAALQFIEEGVRRPPPERSIPIGFELSPSIQREWRVRAA